jgi:ribose transport system substrate-binding protein
MLDLDGRNGRDGARVPELSLARRFSVSRLGQVVLLALALAALALTVGCGDDDSDSADSGSGSSTAADSDGGGQSNVEEAQAEVDKNMPPVKFEPPGPAFDIPASVKGQTIWFVSSGLAFPFSQNLLKGVRDGAAVVGAKVVPGDANGNLAKAASLIEQAISQKADAIILQGIPTETVTSPLKKAEGAGIPVVQFVDDDPGLPSATQAAAGVDAQANSCYACGGRLIADLAIADSGGKVNALFIEVPELKNTAHEREGFEEELKRLCPDCEVQVKSAPIATWGRLGSLAASAIRSDPEINYLVPAVNAMIAPMKPAVAAANAQNDVKFVSYNADLPVMQSIKKGEPVMLGTVGNPEEWMGWALTDQILRLWSDQEPLADEKIPNRVFTQENTADIDLTKPSATWYGDADFRGGYEALWKVEGQ